MKVLVETMECQLEFQILQGTTGIQLYKEVARVLDINESCLFGLQWRRETKVWLKMDKKLSNQIKKLQQESIISQTISQNMVIKTKIVPTLYFLVKFFPENVDAEIIHDNTLKLLYLQVKDNILEGKIKVCLQTALLLASYAAIVSLGPFQPDDLKEVAKLFSLEQMLPKSSTMNCNWSETELKNQIIKWYSEHDIKLREDAMKEYIKVSQDLEMYGVEYHRVYNKNYSKLWLGVHCHGVSIYEDFDKESARLSLEWAEIHHIYCKNKRFLIRTLDKSSPLFCLHTTDKRTTEQIFSSCVGNHELYVKRRQSGHLFHIENLINLAELERRRKFEESHFYKKSLEREVEARKRMEENRNELKSELMEYQNDYKKALKELKKLKISKQLDNKSNEKLKKIIMRDQVEVREEHSEFGIERFMMQEENRKDGRMSNQELQDLNKELRKVTTRTKEIRDDMAQYQQQVSFFMARFYRRHIEERNEGKDEDENKNEDDNDKVEKYESVEVEVDDYDDSFGDNYDDIKEILIQNEAISL